MLRRALVVALFFVFAVHAPSMAGEQAFIRGDSNADGATDISDGVATLGFLFQGDSALPCEDAADANDDGGVDLSDAVATFNFLFLGGAVPPDPGPAECGVDPTDDALGCDAFDPCPTVFDPTGAILAAREGEDGEADIFVPGVVVTYVRPTVDSAPAGFFVQAAATGPAILVELDPAGLDPVPQSGDTVEFGATELGTIFGAQTITAISDFAVVDTGFDLEPWVQDLTDAADAVSGLDNYESELIAVSATISGAFGGAGGGHVAAQIDTAAISGDSDLRVRMPTTLSDVLASQHDVFGPGCSLSLVGPMWRFFDQAQLSAYGEEDVSVTDCPVVVDPVSAILAARVGADGAADIFVPDVVVTYIRPAVASSPSGFFVQAAETGPAILVEVDPASLDSVPQPGDTVEFTATELGTTFGAQTISAIADFAVIGSGFDLGPWIQDLSDAADAVTGLDDYESELIELTATVSGDFNGAGSGHVSAQIDTAAISGDGDLKARIPSDLHDFLASEYEFGPGCEFALIGPMWRYFGQAQPSAYGEDDIAVIGCAAPQVTGAEATSSTEVVVRCDRTILPGSVDDPENQIEFVPELAVLDAVASGMEITITTAEHAPLTGYTVSVSDEITDTLGTGIDPAANSAEFTSLPVGLAVSSVDYPAIAHGARLAISGSGFSDATIVTIGGVDAGLITVESDTSIVVDAVGDHVPVGAQDLVVEVGGDETDPFEVTVIHLVINEVDADQPSTDAAEFIEVSAGIADVDLTGYSVALYNGGNDSRYMTVELAATTDANGLVLIAPEGFAPTPQITFGGATNQVQNGSDAVAILQGTDLPNELPTAGIIDSLLYGTNDTPDAELSAAFGFDGTANDTQSASIQRCGTTRNDLLSWETVEPPTPAAENICGG